jgi:protein ImuB
MPKVVSLFLPTWSTDRLRREMGAAAPSADVPLVLVGRIAQSRIVLAADGAAQQIGLQVGMPATKAQAMVPNLMIRDAHPVADGMASCGRSSKPA